MLKHGSGRGEEDFFDEGNRRGRLQWQKSVRLSVVIRKMKKKPQ